MSYHVDQTFILNIFPVVPCHAAIDVPHEPVHREPPAQRVFQGITHLMQTGGKPNSIYEEAFRRIPGLIDGCDPDVPRIEESLAPLRQGIELVKQGKITRREIENRFVQYVVPLSVAGDDDARASYVPGFNEAISPKAILWPQIRSRWDAERICLVSTERNTGWFHDLCFPGYLWADTEGKWIPPGLTYHDGMSSYDLQNSDLIAAFERLQTEETANGQWGLGGTSLPFGDRLQERFPVVGRFLDERGEPAASRLSADQMAKALKGNFSR